MNTSDRHYFTATASATTASGEPIALPPCEVSIDSGRTWHPVETVDGKLRILLAGPDATDNPQGTLVLPHKGVHGILTRVTDNPEVITDGPYWVRCG